MATSEGPAGAPRASKELQTQAPEPPARRAVPGGRPKARARAARVSLRAALSGEVLATVQLEPHDTIAELQRALVHRTTGPHLAAQLVHGGRRLRAYETQAEVALSDGDSVEVVFGGYPIFTGSGDGTAKAWVGDRCSMTLRGHKDSVLSLDVSPDGRTLATGSADRSVKLWSVESRECIRTLQAQGPVHSVAFSRSGGQVLAACGNGVAVVWSTRVGLQELVLAGHKNRVYSGAWSADGEWIVTASADFTARVWSASNGECLGHLDGHRRVVRSALFAPDGRSIATCSSDRTAKLWSFEDGSCIHDLKGHGGDVFCARFSPDGERLVTGSSDRSAKIWSALSGEALLTLSGHKDTVRAVVFSLDGWGVLTASADSTAKIWDSASGECTLTIAGHSDKVTSAEFAIQCL